jgi:membrane dipeptidase
MTLHRRAFIKGTALASAGLALDPFRLSATGATRHGAGPEGDPSTASPRPSTLQEVHGKATHSVLEEDHPWIFIDACMQMWPDADFHLAHRHGVTTYAVTAWDPHATPESAMEEILYWHWVAGEYPNLPLVRTAADIRRAKREGKAGLLLAAQDGDWVGLELHRLKAFHDLGLRMMLFAYNATNQLAGGCLDRTDGGLTRFGGMVVDECDRLGIVLDCSHVAKRSTLELMERSANPCVFSHSNPSAVVPNPRNIDDEQITACARGGGVVGICSWGPLVMKPGTTARPTVDDYIDLMDHVVQLTGTIGAVGMSTDMSLGTYPQHESDPWGNIPFPDITRQYDEHVTSDITSPERNVEGFDDYALVVDVAERLSDRGYADDEIRAVFGENFLRVFEEVWGA